MDEELKEYLAALGARIKARRKECKMTMRDIMIATGSYDSQWRRYEKGGGVTLGSLLKIAIVLKTTPSILLEGLPLPQWSEMPVLRTPQEHPRGPRPSELAAKKAKRDRGNAGAVQSVER